MSSAVYLKPATPILLADWEAFCAEQGIVYSPTTSGGNYYYFGNPDEDVEIKFGSGSQPAFSAPPAQANEVTVSTYYLNRRVMPMVVDIVKAFRARWRSKMDADPEYKSLLRQRSA